MCTAAKVLQLLLLPYFVGYFYLSYSVFYNVYFNVRQNIYVYLNCAIQIN